MIGCPAKLDPTKWANQKKTALNLVPKTYVPLNLEHGRPRGIAYIGRIHGFHLCNEVNKPHIWWYTELNLFT